MNRIRQTFEMRKAAKQKVLIGFITAGFPNLLETGCLLDTMVSAGCDIIELGVPFSDPVADGPVIQSTSEQALQNGVCLEDCLLLGATFREKHPDIPLILMGYCNPFYKYGLKKLSARLAYEGIDGLIIPDLPQEVPSDWQFFPDCGLPLINFLAPTSRLERLEKIASASSGFIYCISQAGTTGSSLVEVSEQLKERLLRLSELTDTPTALGFGISGAADAAKYSALCDGIIVGSAIAKTVISNQSDFHGPVHRLLKEMRLVLDRN